MKGIVDPDFNTVECCICGVLFGFSSRLMEHRRDTQTDVWCPNGHKIAMTPLEGGKR
jgi:hypothetical protein